MYNVEEKYQKRIEDISLTIHSLSKSIRKSVEERLKREEVKMKRETESRGQN